MKIKVFGATNSEDLERMVNDFCMDKTIQDIKYQSMYVGTKFNQYSGAKQRITDSATMKEVFGENAYLQWRWLRLDEEEYGIISASDSRFRDDGFKFVLSPDDVDAQVSFECDLITD